MKTWFKGALIGAIISIPLIILFFTTSLRFSLFGIIYSPSLFISFMVALISCGEKAVTCPEGWVVFVITLTLFLSLIGAFIGWIIGKIKHN